MAEPTNGNFSRPFTAPAQFDLPGTPEPALSGLASISAEDFEFASDPSENVEVTTQVNRLNGQLPEGEGNVLVRSPETSPETSASLASQEQGIGTFADEFA